MTNISNNDEGGPRGGSAHVSSIDAVARFAGGVREFEDEARNVLIAFDQQTQRALEWLDHEQPMHWQRQIRLQYDEVARARSALANCEMRVVAGDRPSCIEEEKALRAAKQKLEQALEKPDQIRQWAIRVHREVDEFRAKTSGLRHAIESDIPHVLGLLERTLSILEQYTERPIGQRETKDEE